MSNATNPFRASTSMPKLLVGRSDELGAIANWLQGPPLQCVALVGEMHIGKSSILRFIDHAQDTGKLTNYGLDSSYIFAYLDVRKYQDAPQNSLEQASTQFWDDLATSITNAVRKLDITPAENSVPITDLAGFAWGTYRQIRQLLGRLNTIGRRLIVLIDNFEGVAALPAQTASLLRALVQEHDGNLAFIVSCRHRVDLMYSGGANTETSELWQLFADHVVAIGLLSKEDRRAYARNGVGSNFWKDNELDQILDYVGGHPALLRIACAHFYDLRSRRGNLPITESDLQLTKRRVFAEAGPILAAMWSGLSDPQLVGKRRSTTHSPGALSEIQRAVLDLINGLPVDEFLLLVLYERGIIELVNAGSRPFRVFGKILKDYIESMSGENKVESKSAAAGVQLDTKHKLASLSYLEERLYSHLRENAGVVCDRETLSRVIWHDDLPKSESSLQKLVERLRAKVEADHDAQQEIIAVRGRGFMLRTLNMAVPRVAKSEAGI